jgi:hypothetical protein
MHPKLLIVLLKEIDAWNFEKVALNSAKNFSLQMICLKINLALNLQRNFEIYQ